MLLEFGDRGKCGPEYVFTDTLGRQLEVNNVHRDFRAALRDVPGVTATEWTPRELRHSFVSLLSDAGVRLQDISRLVSGVWWGIPAAASRS